MTEEKNVLFSVEENNPYYRLFFGSPTIQRRTFHLETETLVVWGVMLLVSAGLYIHLDVVPFLPIQFSPKTAEIVRLIAFVGLGVNLVRLVGVLLVFAYDSFAIYIKRSISGYACIVCAECGTCTSISRYVERKDRILFVNGCRKCGSFRVYCAKCGKSAHVKHYFQGEGCPHCGYPFFLIKKN
ncbi:MAG TPA: hypothetical protein ENK60_00405 [Anaerolineae bacterium]|nr:hypothetical protein [Anaerolineae bacterium]